MSLLVTETSASGVSTPAARSVSSWNASPITTGRPRRRASAMPLAAGSGSTQTTS